MVTITLFKKKKKKEKEKKISLADYLSSTIVLI